MKHLINGYELKEAYEFKCFSCDHSQMANPSIMMSMGMNTGAGHCLKCKASLHLEIDMDAGVMISTNWETHAEQLKKEMHPPVTRGAKPAGAH